MPLPAAASHLGGLDVLVNNAGIAGPTAPVEEVTPEALDTTLRIDLASMFHCARRAIPYLHAAGSGGHHQSVLSRWAVWLSTSGAGRIEDTGGDQSQGACGRNF